MTALYLHEDVKELLSGKTLVVLGDSVERSVYKDLVCLLQENRYLTDQELRRKGEESFIGDELIYGGCKGEQKNSIDYRECRYYKADDCCCRYYFVTICYGAYIEEVLQELSQEPTDIIVMNSCLWDVHRHGKMGIEKYEENLLKLVAALKRLIPDCLFIWITTPPVHIKSKGGFLMRPGTDLVKINEVRYCNDIARDIFREANETDRRFRVVDLDYVFRHFEHHRASDGVHWNARAHRRMSNMILEEVSNVFDKKVPRVLNNGWNAHEQSYDNANFEQWGSDGQWDNPNNGWIEPYNDFAPLPLPHNGWDFSAGLDFPTRPRSHSYYGPPMPPLPFLPPFPPPPPPFVEEDPRQLLRALPFFDLDDLGHARQQVEQQQETRKRKAVEETEAVVPEKQYRFGVPPSSTAQKRKSSSSESQAKKVSIIEADGVMKKLVRVNEDIVVHASLSEQEKKKYIEDQAKLEKQREKEAKEKRLKEEKEREKEAKKNEVNKKETAAAKEKNDEKPDKVETKEEREFPDLQKILPDVQNLPIVSSVPADEGDKASSEKKPISKFASKLLDFIKKPFSEVQMKLNESSTNEKLQETIDNNSTDIKEEPKSADIATDAVVEEPKVFNVTPLSVLAAKALANKSVLFPEEERRKPDSGQFVRSVFEDKSVNIKAYYNFGSATKPQEIVVNKVVPARPKVDTKALLSMPSPFAKPKPTPAKPTVSSVENKNGDEEDLLLGGDTDDIGSEIDESILDDNIDPNEYSSVSTKPLLASVTKTTTAKPVARSSSGKTPTPAWKTVTCKTASKPASVISPKTLNNSGLKFAPKQNQSSTPVKKTINSTKKPIANSPLLLNNSQSSDSLNDSQLCEAELKKKKKKEKHANETKEERRERKRLKRERKEQKKKLKEKRKEKESAPQPITVVQQQPQQQSPARWNNTIQNKAAPRQRSATWNPMYVGSAYRQKQPAARTLHVQQQQQQQQLLKQQQMQQLALAQQQALLLQQQQLSQNKTQQQQQANQPQLYIDEFGQTYTLEEETYIMGPAGQIQTFKAPYVNQQQNCVAQQSSHIFSQTKY